MHIRQHYMCFKVCHRDFSSGPVATLSHVLLLATPWTAAYQTPPSMGFSRQEYWSGLPLPSPKCPLYTVKCPLGEG